MHHDIEELKKIYSKHAPFDVRVDWSFLDNNRKEIVKRLIKVADLIDDIYWKQSSHDALEWRKKYQNPKRDDEKLILNLIEMNCGPYDRLNFYTAFIGDKPKRAAGAGFYPVDLTQKELEDYVNANPEKKAAFDSQFTVIKRKGKELEAVWYHDEYKKEITEIAALLRDAASFAEEPTLKTYLLARADDLLTDNYFKSDCAWIDLKDPYIDVVVGPYEVYADNLMGTKAGHEAVVMIKNKNETDKLSMYLDLIDEFEKNLPLDNKYKRSSGKGLDTPMIVVDSLYRGGEAKRAMQFVAFSLPNDPKVISEKGSKKVMHKNFFNARFNKITSQISQHVLTKDQLKNLDADCYFSFVVMHEVAHALGPRYVHNTNSPINNALKENYSALEELRANLLSIYLQDYMIDVNKLSSSLREKIYTSFIAGEFRSIRMGHGAYTTSAVIMFNFLLEHGSLTWDGRSLAINYDSLRDGIKKLAAEVSLIEAEGDHKKSLDLVAKYDRMTPFIKSVNEVSGAPIDIWPNYFLS